MTVRVRGIYATALTQLLREADHEVVQASGPIEDRFDGEFADERAAVTVVTTDDQQASVSSVTTTLPRPLPTA